MKDEIIPLELWILFYVVIIIGLIILFGIILYEVITNKIHSSYHKGYREARNDKHNYYETIRDLNEDFTEIMANLKERDVEINIDTITNLIDFGNKIKKYKKKY